MRESYRSVLGRDADEPGLAYWGGRLDSGMPRATFTQQVVLSRESLRAHVATVYDAFGRPPTTTERDAGRGPPPRPHRDARVAHGRPVRHPGVHQQPRGGSRPGRPGALPGHPRSPGQRRRGRLLDRGDLGRHRRARRHAGRGHRLRLLPRAPAVRRHRRLRPPAGPDLRHRGSRLLGRTDPVRRQHPHHRPQPPGQRGGLGPGVQHPRLQPLHPAVPERRLHPAGRRHRHRSPGGVQGRLAAPAPGRAGLRPHGVEPPGRVQPRLGDGRRLQRHRPRPVRPPAADRHRMPPSTPDSPIVLVDTATDERIPVWAELDANATADDDRALLIRPARNMRDGHTYAVGIGQVRDASGAVIAAPGSFRRCLDDPPSPSRRVREECEATQAAADEVAAAGLDRSTTLPGVELHRGQHPQPGRAGRPHARRDPRRCRRRHPGPVHRHQRDPARRRHHPHRRHLPGAQLPHRHRGARLPPEAGRRRPARGRRTALHRPLHLHHPRLGGRDPGPTEPVRPRPAGDGQPGQLRLHPVLLGRPRRGPVRHRLHRAGRRGPAQHRRHPGRPVPVPRAGRPQPAGPAQPAGAGAADDAAERVRQRPRVPERRPATR